MANSTKLTLLAAATLLLAPYARAQQIDDPANLMGERVSPQSPADDLSINHGTPALQQLLLHLRTRASLMFIVAHPDDEDGGFLTLESRGHGTRVAMLTLTRGEGGQNLMSADFNDALGLIRTQELLLEDRYMGIDQFFGTAVDFGFSKTKEEALHQWTHDRVLYDAVRAVRLYRPLILASVFVGGPTDGHGHHQVAGEISQEVFLAAADPSVFPEMHLPPWAPLKVYARVPFSRVTDAGMFDYATGKTIPTLFHNYVTGVDIHTAPTATVQIHEGDPALVNGKNAYGMDGLTYLQFARQALANQKSQIDRSVRLAPAGKADVGYTLLATRISCETASGGCPKTSPAAPPLTWQAKPETLAPDPSFQEQDLYQNIDTTLPGIATLAPNAPTSLALQRSLEAIDAQAVLAQNRFSPMNPGATAEPLRSALRQLDTLLAATEKSTTPAQEKFNLLHELRIKRVQFNNALLLAEGVEASATLTSQTSGPSANIAVVAGYTVATSASARSTSSAQLTSVTLRIDGKAPLSPTPRPVAPFTPEGPSGQTLGTHPITHDFYALAPTPITRPYFSRASLEQPFYDLASPDLRNAPATPAPLVATFLFSDQGVNLELPVIVSHPAEGARVPQPAVIVPDLSVRVDPAIAILPPAGGPARLSVFTQVQDGKVAASLTLPKGWTAHSDDATLNNNLDHPIDWTAHFQLSAPPLTPGQDYKITAQVAGVFNPASTESFRPVGYPGLTYTNFYTPATYRAVAVDVTTAPNLRIAYLPGTGDDVPAFLPNLGITPTLLTPADLTPEKLSHYDAVMLGVRAYSAHPELNGAAAQTLNDYATAGGIVFVQYNSGNFSPSSAPYPYTLPGDSAHNVVEEADPVTLLDPANPLLTWPNRITSADFDQWTEERGHGFPSTWDPHYTALLETHDPGQDPQRGGLLLAKVGKGAYIYCALALYRQLPEAVPGAYRLLANLLSYPKNPTR